MGAERTDQLLVQRIRRGDAAAWKDCIERYEGRLLAFAESRLRDRGLAEDVVQETLIGFLNALANYDDETPLEAFLFAIAAHKLTDFLRRMGRRPALTMGDPETAAGSDASRERPASSLLRSRERRSSEEQLVAATFGPLIEEWKRRGQFERLKCVELLFVKGLKNKQVADVLGLSEQDVANHKYAAVSRLKASAGQARRDDFDTRALLGE